MIHTGSVIKSDYNSNSLRRKTSLTEAFEIFKINFNSPAIFLSGILCLLCAWAIPPTGAVIPIPCVHNVTTRHVCCPAPKFSSEVCGGPRRGACEKIDTFRDKVLPQYLFDDRLHWPSKFFTHGCKCRGNFFGVACERCFYGWEGRHCERKVMTVRRNIQQLSVKEAELFRNVLAQSYHEPSEYYIIVEQDNIRSDPINGPVFYPANVHYYFVFLHRFASRSTLFNNQNVCQKYGILDFNHDGPVFMTWHRYFMLSWERALAEIALKYWGVKGWTIPYWNWLDTERCEICHNQLAGGVGPIDVYGQRLSKHSVFHNWTEYCSEPVTDPICYGCHYSGQFGKLTRHWNNERMPTTDDIDYIMSFDNFYSTESKDGQPCKAFGMAVEGFCGPPNTDTGLEYMHNFIHNSLDGSMCCSATATNDPLFLIHHVEVDRMIQAWWQDHTPKYTDFPNENLRPGHCRECHMTGFFPALRNGQLFRDCRDFGYTYDSFEFGKRGRVYGTGKAQNLWNGNSRHSLNDPQVRKEMQQRKKLQASVATEKNKIITDILNQKI